MCGEHIVANRNCGSVQGSSPHVRGARAGRARPAGPSGIIPACAGSTGHSRFRVLLIRDHPRMCGEHRSLTDSLSPARGSSPHVRGALPDLVPGVEEGGIIPACAGSTAASIQPVSASWDHPRMCGEHMVSTRRICQPSGSSPHVRGAQSLGIQFSGTTGIIPACAGSTESCACVL